MVKSQPNELPAEAPLLQRLVQKVRNFFPRGWAPLLMTLARIVPQLQCYPARMLDGTTLHLDLRESMCFSYFFYGELPHERATRRILTLFLDTGGCFVDVGANVGYFTLLASRLVGASGSVRAFEPSPQALPSLYRNVRDLKNVKVQSIALGSKHGQVDFYARSSGDTSSLEPEADAQVICVEMNTLDDELRAVHRVDLIKIDVEGFEIDVLRGAREALHRLRCPVYFEVIPDYLNRRNIDLSEFHAFLREVDYVARWVNLDALGETDLFLGGPSTYVLALPAGAEHLQALGLADTDLSASEKLMHDSA